ncbi:MAG: hypothetical protein GIKADHBN_01746 [Phycisphaerales bacterium]|nr:hypothetical protein [Phycisphaerales bacterium]
MLTGPWCLDRNSGAIETCFLAWTDYRAKALNSADTEPRGGVFSIAQATRSSGSAPWTTAPVSQVVYRVGFADYVPSTDPTNGTPRDEGMHCHNGAVLPKPGGGIVTVLSIGDSTTNNRLVKFERSDLNYTAGEAPVPTINQYPVQSATNNGWTTYEDREGQRRRIHFPDGATAVSGSGNTKYQHSSFANIDASFAADTPLRYGTFPVYGSTARITGKDGSDVIILSTAVTPDASNKIYGMIAPDNSSQVISHAPLAATDHVLMGSDESMAMLYRAKITDAAKTVRLEHVWGVPPEMLGYKRVIVITDPVPLWFDSNASRDVVANWNVFLIVCAKPRQGQHYIASVHPGNLTLWNQTATASTLLYSIDGAGDAGAPWGDLFLTEEDPGSWTPVAFYGTDAIYIPLRRGAGGLASIPMPVTKVAQPLCIGGGIDANHLRQTTPSGVPSIDQIDPQGGTNDVDPVSSSDLATLGVTPPPSLGPVMRFTATDHSYLGIYQMTDTVVTAPASMRIPLWLYVLPPAENPSNPNTPPYAATGGSLRLRFGWQNFSGVSTISPPIDVSSASGRGWIPFVVTTNTRLWQGETPPSSTFSLKMQVSTNATVFARQDVLIAFDGVVMASAEPENPGQPLRIANSTPDEKFTVSGWGCGNQYTFYIAARIPETGSDICTATNGWPLFDTAAPGTTGRVLLTLWESSSKYLKLILDRRPKLVSDAANGHEVAENRLVLVDHQSNYAVLEGPTSTVDTAFRQPFLFLKGRQVLIGVCYDTSIGTSGGYRVWASVGGSEVASAEFPGLQQVKPTTVQTGDQNKTNVDPSQLFVIAADNSNPTTLANGKAALETLSFWP